MPRAEILPAGMPLATVVNNGLSTFLRQLLVVASEPMRSV